MPGPSSSTLSATRSPLRLVLTSTCVPAGVWRNAFSTSARPTWRIRCSSPRPGGAAVDAVAASSCPVPWAQRVELLEEELGDLGEVDRLALDAQAAGVEAGEVEQLAGELRQPLDLLAHAPEELPPGRLVEVLLDEELEVAAEREERRAELVRGVRDELAARVLEPREALAHAVEGAGELAELVRARVDDRLVELPVRDPLGRLLESADASREEPRAAVAEQERQRRARTAPRSPGDA